MSFGLSFSEEFFTGEYGLPEPCSILEAAERLDLDERRQLAHDLALWRYPRAQGGRDTRYWPQSEGWAWDIVELAREVNTCSDLRPPVEVYLDSEGWCTLSVYDGSREWERLLEEAAALGREAGENAAAWWEQDAIGGRVSDAIETAIAILQGLEDGDPAVLDSLPYPNLSGQWAGDPTPSSLYEELEFEGDDDSGELCSAWEEAAGEAAQHAIEKYCRELIEADRHQRAISE